MTWFKRIFLFILTNVAVIAVLMTITSVFGIEPYLTPYGLNLVSLAIYAAIIGFTGALISLFLSKTIAKWTAGVKIIDTPNNSDETFLMNSVKQLSNQAGLGMPEVGIYDSSEINAFATGWNRNNALIAVSSGLLNQMSQDEVEGVLAHEMAHIRNGDMVTMTLIQGVVNTFVIFAARVAAYAVMKAMDKEEVGGLVYWVVSIVFEITFGILASTIVFAFSRWREFGADYGGASLAGKQKMMKALQFLEKHQQSIDSRHKNLATMKISDRPGFMALFASHPPLGKRIQALQQAPIS